MIVYPITNTDGKIVGRVALENNEIPEMIMRGQKFKLDANFYPKSSQFMNFQIVPVSNTNEEVSMGNEEPKVNPPNAIKSLNNHITQGHKGSWGECKEGLCDSVKRLLKVIDKKS